MVSHAGCRAVHDHRRNLTDEQLAAIADRDGVVCVPADASLVAPQRRTIGSVVAHIEHAIAIVGTRHVGLGGDFLAQLAASGALGGSRVRRAARRLRRSPFVVRGLGGPEDYPNLVAALRERELGADEVRAISFENVVRVLANALPR
jgi:membrane dipeptidase